MHPYLLTTAARQNLIDIDRFTTQKWEKRQRENTSSSLMMPSSWLLARQPEIGRDADDIKPKYKKFSLGSHTIFYRAGTESTIVVIRILYNSMDVDRHL